MIDHTWDGWDRVWNRIEQALRMLETRLNTSGGREAFTVQVIHSRNNIYPLSGGASFYSRRTRDDVEWTLGLTFDFESVDRGLLAGAAIGLDQEMAMMELPQRLLSGANEEHLRNEIDAFVDQLLDFILGAEQAIRESG